MAIAKRYIHKLSTTKAKKLLTAARRTISKDIAPYNAFYNLQVMSVIKGKNAGKIIGKMYELPKRIEKKVEPITEKYALKILSYSQELVPIDKKYIGKFNTQDSSLFKVKRDTYFYVPYGTFLDVKAEKSNKDFYSDIRNRKYEPFDLKKGIYFGEQADFIKEFFRGSNKEKRYQLYQDPNTKQLHSASARYGLERSFGFKLSDVKPATGTTKQMSGGNQELKRSGRVEDVGINSFRIVYDPRYINPNLWNYAQIQHDNLAYKHKVGEPLYLYKAFERYRQDYYKEVSLAVNKSVKEINNG